MYSTFSGKFRNNCFINWNFLEHNSVMFRNSRTTSQKFPVYGQKSFQKSFQNSGIFSIMEMEKISGSFPYVNHNPEFRWKPYLPPLFGYDDDFYSGEGGVESWKWMSTSISSCSILFSNKGKLIVKRRWRVWIRIYQWVDYW